MALSVGTRIGQYEIVAAIGAGGMGTVYRARDTRLNRDVALKTLLPSLVADAERIARFEREAQVLASLNHPNIAQKDPTQRLHDIADARLDIDAIDLKAQPERESIAPARPRARGALSWNGTKTGTPIRPTGLPRARRSCRSDRCRAS